MCFSLTNFLESSRNTNGKNKQKQNPRRRKYKKKKMVHSDSSRDFTHTDACSTFNIKLLYTHLSVNPLKT